MRMEEMTAVDLFQTFSPSTYSDHQTDASGGSIFSTNVDDTRISDEIVTVPICIDSAERQMVTDLMNIVGQSFDNPLENDQQSQIDAFSESEKYLPNSEINNNEDFSKITDIQFFHDAAVKNVTGEEWNWDGIFNMEKFNSFELPDNKSSVEQAASATSEANAAVVVNDSVDLIINPDGPLPGFIQAFGSTEIGRYLQNGKYINEVDISSLLTTPPISVPSNFLAPPIPIATPTTATPATSIKTKSPRGRSKQTHQTAFANLRQNTAYCATKRKESRRAKPYEKSNNGGNFYNADSSVRWCSTNAEPYSPNAGVIDQYSSGCSSKNDCYHRPASNYTPTYQTPVPYNGCAGCAAAASYQNTACRIDDRYYQYSPQYAPAYRHYRYRSNCYQQSSYTSSYATQVSPSVQQYYGDATPYHQYPASNYNAPYY